MPSNRGTTRKAEPTSSPISTTITTVRTTTSGVDIPFFAGGPYPYGGDCWYCG